MKGVLFNLKGPSCEDIIYFTERFMNFSGIDCFEEKFEELFNHWMGWKGQYSWQNKKDFSLLKRFNWKTRHLHLIGSGRVEVEGRIILPEEFRNEDNRDSYFEDILNGLDRISYGCVNDFWINNNIEIKEGNLTNKLVVERMNHLGYLANSRINGVWKVAEYEDRLGKKRKGLGFVGGRFARDRRIPN